MTAAVSILMIGLPLLLIGGSVWAMFCDRSKPFRDESMDVPEQVMRMGFHEIESWLLAKGDRTVDRAIWFEAQRLRETPGWDSEPPPFGEP